MGNVCQICGVSEDQVELVPAAIIRPAIADVIERAKTEWSPTGFVCVEDLNAFRSRYIEELLEAEKGELTSLEDDVVRSLSEHEILSSDVETEFTRGLSFGERLSDRMASFGGSWTFILFFVGVLVVWVAVNSLWYWSRPFDPYPFILLNLVLSCVAALQAPVIMMSQNRQEAKDRIRSQHDYQVNLKAELEIRQLHQKVDHLLTHQWERLIEIQRIQVELMNDLRNARGQSRGEQG